MTKDSLLVFLIVKEKNPLVWEFPYLLTEGVLDVIKVYLHQNSLKKTWKMSLWKN